MRGMMDPKIMATMLRMRQNAPQGQGTPPMTAGNMVRGAKSRAMPQLPQQASPQTVSAMSATPRQGKSRAQPRPISGGPGSMT